MTSKEAPRSVTPSTQGPRVSACGDDQILVDLSEVEHPNDVVRILWARLMEDPPHYCQEPVAGVTTLAVVLRPEACVTSVREQACRALEVAARKAIGNRPTVGVQHEIPVCYHPSMAPDLSRVAQWTGLSAYEVVELHQTAVYLAELIGFMPGFAYLSGVDSALSVPRLEQPRPTVPPGALAITGHQSAIYPASTPGGWNLIGRCPIRLFNPALPKPSLIQLGDEVRFESITPAQFDRLWARR